MSWFGLQLLVFVAIIAGDDGFATIKSGHSTILFYRPGSAGPVSSWTLKTAERKRGNDGQRPEQSQYD